MVPSTLPRTPSSPTSDASSDPVSLAASRPWELVDLQIPDVYAMDAPRRLVHVPCTAREVTCQLDSDRRGVRGTHPALQPRQPRADPEPGELPTCAEDFDAWPAEVFYR